MCAKAGNWDQSEGFLTKIDRLNTSIYRFGFLTSRLDLSAAMLILGNLRWRRFRGDGDRTGKESLELRQPSLSVKNRTLRSQ